MYNRLTRRRKLYLLVFIVILLTALWLLIRPRPTTAQVLGASVTDVRVVSYDPRGVDSLGG